MHMLFEVALAPNMFTYADTSYLMYHGVYLAIASLPMVT